jgi:hypothetical protein
MIGGWYRMVAIEWWELVVFRLVGYNDVCNQPLTSPLLDDDKNYVFVEGCVACEHVCSFEQIRADL